MAGLAATFERRLTYRLKRYLHACLGAGVLFGMAHLMLLGVDEPVELLIVLSVLLLTSRAARDDWGLGARPYAVRSSHPIARGTIEITLAPLADPIDIRPSQFVQAAFFGGPSFHGCGEFHPFTVCGIDADGSIRIAVKAAGDCTTTIQPIKAGTAARIHGAFGDLFAKQRSGSALWVAGGVGVTPFVSMLRSGRLTAPTLLLYLYRSTAEATFLPDLEAFARTHPKFSLRAIATGNVMPDLTTVLPDANWPADRECYVAGPIGLIESVSRLLRSRGITQDVYTAKIYRICDAMGVRCCDVLILDRYCFDLG
jgi:predicted ferric reductase